MDNLWSTLVLAVIEGVTEFLPISSTGHLLIAEHWLGRRSETYNILIQVGSVLAVTLIYREKLRALVLRWTEPAMRDYLLKLGAAFGITCVLGLVARKLGWNLPDRAEPIAWAMVLGGVAILWTERRLKRLPTTNEITWGIAIAVGIAQMVAGIFPGTSRSAATILIALWLGASRPAGTEFAFLVGIPTMLAACGLAFYSDLNAGAVGRIEPWWELGVAFVVAGLVAFATVKWLLGYIQRHSFTPFGWYRIVVGGALLVWIYWFGAAI